MQLNAMYKKPQPKKKDVIAVEVLKIQNEKEYRSK